MSVSVSGTSAVPVVLLRVLRRQIPFGRLTVPGRIDGATRQRAVHFAELVEDPHEIVVLQAARPRIVGMHQQLDVGARQFAERRADRPLARRRNERRADSARSRDPAGSDRARAASTVERRREQIDLPVRGVREDVDELNRRRAARRRRHRAVAQVARRSAPAAGSSTLTIRSSSPAGSSSFSRPSRVHSSPNTSALERASPTASITGRPRSRLIGP